VLLIDADLRRGSLNLHTGVPSSPGLTDVVDYLQDYDRSCIVR
jgi:tyrosine-protein kinase Etk/Wzc